MEVRLAREQTENPALIVRGKGYIFSRALGPTSWLTNINRYQFHPSFMKHALAQANPNSNLMYVRETIMSPKDTRASLLELNDSYQERTALLIPLLSLRICFKQL